MQRETLRYRVKDKGGLLGGKEIQREIPSFSLEEFMKAPNAAEFVKKAYYAAAKKISREVEENKNGSVPADLTTYEMIIARSINFTKSDINSWLATRDWARIESFEHHQSLRLDLEAWLPNLANRNNHLRPQLSNKIAERLIAALAGDPDPVADYLFVLLTNSRESRYPDLLDL